MKDFDGWYIQKKATHNSEQNKWCNERDIWWCRLGVNIGDEQDGKGERLLRPVLVLRKFNKSVCLIVPLSTQIKSGSYYVKFTDKKGTEAVAIISQLRLIDTKRLFKRADKIEKKYFEMIKKAIIQLFV